MAFTTLTAGDIHPTNAAALVTEIKAAIDQRRLAIGQSAGSYSSTGVRATNWRTNLETFRIYCEDLIADSGYTVGGLNPAQSGFVKSDLTEYANFAGVLSAAGHGGVWIDIDTTGPTDSQDNYRVSGAAFIALWQQIIDVLGELIYYRVTVGETTETVVYTRSYPSGNGERYASAGTNEGAWDNAKADTPSGTITIPLGGDWGVGWFTQPAEWWLLGPTERITFNLDNQIGTCLQADVVFIGHEEFATDGTTITVEDEFALMTFVTTGGATPSSSFDLKDDIAPGSATSTVDYSVTTTEPATRPWEDPSGEGTGAVIYLTQGTLGVDPHFYFDITSALTYG